MFFCKVILSLPHQKRASNYRPLESGVDWTCLTNRPWQSNILEFSRLVHKKPWSFCLNLMKRLVLNPSHHEERNPSYTARLCVGTLVPNLS